MSHKKKGSKTGKTKRSEVIDVHQLPIVIIQKNNITSKDGGKNTNC